MKIAGIENILNDIDLQNDINNRNFSNFVEKIKVIHKYKSGTNMTAIIETPPEIYNFIRNNENKIYVGTQRCVAYDDIDIIVCKNYARYKIIAVKNVKMRKHA